MSYPGWNYGHQQYGNASPYPQQQPQYPGYQQAPYGAPQSSAGFYGHPGGYPAQPSPPPQMFAPLAPRPQSHFTYGPARSMPTMTPAPVLYAAPPAYPPQPIRRPQPQPSTSTSSNDLNDPNVFRNNFRAGLQQLTFNSRAHIEKLTSLADEYSLRMATIVSDEIHTHLRTVPAHMKLPALYLTDMIAKNISHPYIALFARFMDRVFLQAYRDVDLPTKHKMEELLGSWRTGGPNGSEVYPERTMKLIEEGLYGVRGRGGGIGASGRGKAEAEHYNAGLQQRPSMASSQEVAILLQEIRHVLGVSQAKAYRDPHDQATTNSLDLLRQLEATVSSNGVTEEQLNAIRQQLSGLSSQSSEESGPSTSQALDGLSAMPPSTVSAVLSGQSSLSEALANLDPSLVASLGAISGPRPAQRDSTEVAYEDKLFSGFGREQDQVGLTLAHINRPSPNADQLLYDDLALQCTQCAARWLETERHHKVLQKHMDRHFRINNRLSGALRAQSRNWLVLEEDWLSAPLPEAEDPDKQEEAEIAAEVARSFVKVPEDPIKASKPCPICKEKFKQQWNESQEDFVWKDAKQVDGAIYHASCYLETRKARNQSKKAKTEGSLTSSVPPSREGTPQVGTPSKSQNEATNSTTSVAPIVKVEETEASPSQAASTLPASAPVSTPAAPAIAAVTTDAVETAPEEPQASEFASSTALESQAHVKQEEETEPQVMLSDVRSEPPAPSTSAPNISTDETVVPSPAAAFTLDSSLLETLASIVTRTGTPPSAPSTSAPEAIAAASAADASQTHSRKRSVDAMDQPDGTQASDAQQQAVNGQSEHQVKKARQENGDNSEEEEDALYSVSAHR